MMKLIIVSLPIAKLINQPIGVGPTHKIGDDANDSAPMTSCTEDKAATREVSQDVERKDIDQNAIGGASAPRLPKANVFADEKDANDVIFEVMHIFELREVEETIWRNQIPRRTGA